MVTHMMPFKCFPDSAPHREMVRCIMSHIIGNVANNKARKHWCQPQGEGKKVCEDEPEKAIEEQCQWNAYDWGHNQARFALWLQVVNTVK